MLIRFTATNTKAHASFCGSYIAHSSRFLFFLLSLTMAITQHAIYGTEGLRAFQLTYDKPFPAHDGRTDDVFVGHR